LVAPGLYVAVKEAATTVPSSKSQLKDFREVINLLFKFKVHILKKDKQSSVPTASIGSNP
jgi:hypothetical protein